MANRETVPSWIETWDFIVHSIHTVVRNTKKKYPEAQKSIEVIEAPARTIAIRANGVPGAFVQVRISLTGDQIDVETEEKTTFGRFPDKRKIIKIESVNSNTVFITEDDERITDSMELAERILGPLLDCYRAVRC
jgi:hypothetical protein